VWYLRKRLSFSAFANLLFVPLFLRAEFFLARYGGSRRLWFVRFPRARPSGGTHPPVGGRRPVLSDSTCTSRPPMALLLKSLTSIWRHLDNEDDFSFYDQYPAKASTPFSAPRSSFPLYDDPSFLFSNNLVGCQSGCWSAHGHLGNFSLFFEVSLSFPRPSLSSTGMSSLRVRCLPQTPNSCMSTPLTFPGSLARSSPTSPDARSTGRADLFALVEAPQVKLLFQGALPPPLPSVFPPVRCLEWLHPPSSCSVA